MDNTLNILNSLVHLGLSPEQARVYIACLKSGAVKAPAIAKAATMNRTVVYRYLKDLTERGLLHVSLNRGIRTFTVAKPDIWSMILHQRQQELEAILPALFALYSTHTPTPPQLRFYTDIAGIKTVLEEILHCESKFYRVFGAFYDKEFRALLGIPYLRRWTKRRIARGVNHQALRSDHEPPDRKHLDPIFLTQGKAVLREYRFLPLPTNLPLTINLFDDKVCLIGARIGHIYAAVLESKDLFAVLNSIFDILWSQAKQPQQ